MIALLACTAFLLRGPDGAVVGKSYDWSMGHGAVLVNPRGLAKEALRLHAEDVPLRWVSRHASLTFNQYGRELPNGGMNDAGLVVEVLWLDSARYPPADARPAVNELEWIQYQLDNFASVDEMVAAADRVRVARVYAAVHYFACDRRECAAFEWLDGKLRVSRGVHALANNPYAESVRWAAGHDEPRGAGSLARFARAQHATQGGVAGAFAVLDSVRAPETQWNIVYEPEALRVSWRTRAAPAVKTASLAPAACGLAAEGFALDDGGRTAFGPAENHALVARTVGALPVPAALVDAAAAHGGAARCTATSP